ncbi:MAG TPA: hypothetical protein VNF99_19955 [Stellaceae bacterium]|nr:hypothetical protein [Stellaceae bacterium]
MAALTTAFFTAALALLGTIILSLWNRYRERSSIAGALAGEIGAYATLIDAPTSVVAYRKLATFEHAIRRRRLRSMPKTPVGHPVFDKVADKIGLLPSAESQTVSAIYNIVSGFRIIHASLSSPEMSEADDEVQIALLNKVAETIERYAPDAHELATRLNQISRESFWQFVQREVFGH